MTGIGESYPGISVNLKIMIVRNPDEEAHAGIGIGFPVDGFNRREALAGPLFIEPDHIMFLDKPTVGEHNRTKGACGMGTDYRAPESVIVHKRDKPGMINVRVGQDEVINFCRVKSQVPVGGIGFEAFALEHPAVEKDGFTIFGCNEVLAPGDFTGGSDKLDFHSTV